METLFNADFGNKTTIYLFQDYMVNVNIYSARLCEGNLNSKIEKNVRNAY